MNNSVELNLLGQSLWYDNLQRSLIKDGTLKGMIERREIYGVTSNPSIFQNAIANSHDYDADLMTMSWAGMSPKDMFYRLAIKDIQDLADLFLPYYEASKGGDGYVSLEVNPNLAHDTQQTIEEAQWLWHQVDRPNLMVKIPATKAGLPAITESIAAGVNINVTLIFSRKRYHEVMEAYVNGLSKRLEKGLPIDSIASVASFFVSRFETNADGKLQKLIDSGGGQVELAKSLVGKMAVANTRLAYQDYEKFFDSEKFNELSKHGAKKQRPLWASTSTKDPAYPDIKYVESLVADNTVNTLPPETLEAYLDHGEPSITIYEQLEQAEGNFNTLADLGISIHQITQELEDEGVRKFSESFDQLLGAIENRKQEFLKALGKLSAQVKTKVEELDKKDLVGKVYRHDPTLWADSLEGHEIIQKRLGWLHLPDEGLGLVSELSNFVEKCRQDGMEKVLLLGMGGSSLAAETMSTVFGQLDMGLSLRILDSTIPAQISEAEAWVDYEKTLFIVASKSGTTTEPLALFSHFWEQSKQKLGEQRANHFIAITDPGSHLTDLALEKSFRALFTSNPNVGGRYSALSHFGLVPAALAGIDLDLFIANAKEMAESCSPLNPAEQNFSLLLGIILGIGALNGRDKLTILSEDFTKPIGAWLEQLVAESSGKQGRGLIPIDREQIYPAATYSTDRVFVYLRHNGHMDDLVSELRSEDQPVVTLEHESRYDLAGSFYLWEFATAIACSILDVNAFDQPDVQDSKDRTKKKISTYIEQGQLDHSDAVWHQDGIHVFGDAFDGIQDCRTFIDLVNGFISKHKHGDYVAINAYLPRNEEFQEKLTALREYIHAQTGLSTTLGFGPRFLHSSGQLHKGGPNTGLFIQITQDNKNDFNIPGQKYTFGILASAQAQGDMDALVDKGRRVMRIHFSDVEKLTI